PPPRPLPARPPDRQPATVLPSLPAPGDDQRAPPHPARAHISVVATDHRGPRPGSGPTSAAVICTSKPELYAKPRAHNRMSEPARESQKWFSPRRSRTGSFRMPPCSPVRKTYLHCPTRHFDRSRRMSILVKSKASGPVISTCRSTPTSHSVTPFSSAQYSPIGSP